MIPQFTDAEFPVAQNEYVLWVDIMGTKSSMSTSIRTSAIFICKLHIAIMMAKTANVHVYPMMDGAYVTTKNKNDIMKFIKKLFVSLGDMFIAEPIPLHKYIIKGALAYGPIVHGENIPASCNSLIDDNREYVNSILLGTPMIRACQGEKKAPPFGIYCDESARMADSLFAFRWFKWCTDANKKEQMREALNAYFDYSEKHCFEMDYPIEKVKEHRTKAIQYFE